jgi:hypothetical protein
VQSVGYELADVPGAIASAKCGPKVQKTVNGGRGLSSVMKAEPLYIILACDDLQDAPMRERVLAVNAAETRARPWWRHDGMPAHRTQAKWNSPRRYRFRFCGKRSESADKETPTALRFSGRRQLEGRAKLGQDVVRPDFGIGPVKLGISRRPIAIADG